MAPLPGNIWDDYLTVQPVSNLQGDFVPNTQPYHVGVPADALLSTYSVIGFRTDNLGDRPPMKEVYGYEEYFRNDFQSTTHVYDVPCSMREVAMRWWLGYSEALQDGMTGQWYIHRVLPAQDPRWPHLYAQEVRFIEPRDLNLIQDPQSVYTDDNGDEQIIPAPFYAYRLPPDPDNGQQEFNDGAMRYAVTFAPLPYELLEDEELDGLAGGEMNRYVERRVTFAVRAQPIPGSIIFKFTEGPSVGTQIPGQPQVMLPGGHWQYTWHDVPDVPYAAFQACVGRVNSAPFDGCKGWPSHPEQTMLCFPMEIHRYRTVTGRTTWNIVWHFERCPSDKGWNAFLDAKDRQFHLAGIADPPGGPGDPNKPLYELADFSQLFVLPQTP